jgi:hypothetical protein
MSIELSRPLTWGSASSKLASAVEYFEGFTAANLMEHQGLYSTRSLRFFVNGKNALSMAERILRGRGNLDLDLISSLSQRLKALNSRLQTPPNSSTHDSILQSPFELIESVQAQFKRTFELVLEKQEEWFETHLQSSPLSSFYRCIQNLKQNASPSCSNEFLRLFEFLSRDDKLLLVKEFSKLCFSDQDKAALIEAKCSRLLIIRDKTFRAELESALLSSSKFNEEELMNWAIINMPKRVAELESSFEAFLLEKFTGKTEMQKQGVYEHLRTIAKQQDCLQIPDWDKEWGKYHLQMNTGSSFWAFRLARALQIVDKQQRELSFQDVYRQCQIYGDKIASCLFKHCPLVDAVRKGEPAVFSPEVVQEVMARADFLSKLQKCKHALLSKHPTLADAINDPSHLLHKLWKEKENAIVLWPGITDSKMQGGKRVIYASILIEALDALAQDGVDAGSAGILLEVILKRLSFHPRQDQISGQVDLHEIKRRGIQQASRKGFWAASHSLYKEIFTIQESDNSPPIGKYKPNHPGFAAREVKGYVYDSILGLGITPPTGLAQLSMESALLSLQNSFQLSNDKFEREADALMGMEMHNVAGESQEALEQWKLAELYRLEALDLQRMAMDQFSNFPEEIKQGLYKCLFARLGLYSCLSDRAGDENSPNEEQLWWTPALQSVTDKQRACAIGDFLGSELFQRFKISNSFETKDKVGSIQKWINEPCQRVIDFIVKNPSAGGKLKTIPKASIHLYCILGLIKGSKDGYSGNALFTFSEEGKIKQIHEFDDEKSMPRENKWYEFRIWQFGLPQADQPFDRTTLLLFSKEELLKEIQVYNRTDKKQLVLLEAYIAQEQRIATMIKLFQKELEKPALTLTPRDLFFAVAGGRENFEYWHKQKSLNPWVVFEYCTGDTGRGKYFVEEEKRAVLQANFDILYHDRENIAKTLLEAVRVNYPRVRLVIKYNTGFGNTLRLRGSFLGLNWSSSTLLRCIDADTWIYESDQEVIGEYKIYLSNSSEIEEVNCSARRLDTNHVSKVITPSFP